MIRDCPKLYSITLFPYLEELHMVNSNLRLLEQTISNNSRVNIFCLLLFFFNACCIIGPLSKLKSLIISPTEGSDGHLLQNIQYLIALEELSIFNCNEMGWNWNGKAWKGFRIYLYIIIQNWLIFQWGFNISPLCKTLRLEIVWDWKLQSLAIWVYHNLTSLPKWMSGLTFLKKLYIQSYPILVESCKSEDWLAHTQNLKGDLVPSKEEDVLNFIMQNKVVSLHSL